VNITNVSHSLFYDFGFATAAPSSAQQSFRAALYARLASSNDLASLVGTRIFYAVLPQTYDLGRHGPAVTFFVVARPMGHHLRGASGVATARVQVSAWAYRESTAEAIAEAVRNLLDGPQPAWGNGTVHILSCYQEDEVDLPEEPRAGTDLWTYQIASDYSILHRVLLPTLS
jgi:hypothetical protein